MAGPGRAGAAERQRRLKEGTGTVRATKAPPGPRRAARGFRGCAVPGREPLTGAAAEFPTFFPLRVVVVPSRAAGTSAGPPFLPHCIAPSVTGAIFRSGSSFLPQGRHCPVRALNSPSEPPFPPQGCPFLPQGHHFALRVITFPSVSPLRPHSTTFSPRAAISPSGFSFPPHGGHSGPRANTAGKKRSIWSILRISIPHFFPLQTA